MNLKEDEEEEELEKKNTKVCEKFWFPVVCLFFFKLF